MCTSPPQLRRTVQAEHGGMLGVHWTERRSTMCWGRTAGKNRAGGAAEKDVLLLFFLHSVDRQTCPGARLVFLIGAILCSAWNVSVAGVCQDILRKRIFAVGLVAPVEPGESCISAAECISRNPWMEGSWF